MGQIGAMYANGAAGYVGELAADAMIELEQIIDTITNGRPGGRMLELRYHVSLAKMVAFDVQGVTPLPDFPILMPPVPTELIETNNVSDDFTAPQCLPWQWPYGSEDPS